MKEWDGERKSIPEQGKEDFQPPDDVIPEPKTTLNGTPVISDEKFFQEFLKEY